MKFLVFVFLVCALPAIQSQEYCFGNLTCTKDADCTQVTDFGSVGICCGGKCQGHPVIVARGESCADTKCTTCGDGFECINNICESKLGYGCACIEDDNCTSSVCDSMAATAGSKQCLYDSLGNGSPCVRDGQCVSTNCSQGVCVAQALGLSCEEPEYPDACNGGYCSNSSWTCEPFVPMNGDCFSDSQCAPGLFCIGHSSSTGWSTCVAPPPVGGACIPFSENPCGYQLVCNNDVCVKPGSLPSGASCSDPAACKSMSCSSANQCATVVPVGATCDGESTVCDPTTSYCLPDMHTAQMKCVGYGSVPDGEFCFASALCKSGNCSVSTQTCAPLGSCNPNSTDQSQCQTLFGSATCGCNGKCQVIDYISLFAGMTKNVPPACLSLYDSENGLDGFHVNPVSLPASQLKNEITALCCAVCVLSDVFASVADPTLIDFPNSFPTSQTGMVVDCATLTYKVVTGDCNTTGPELYPNAIVGCDKFKSASSMTVVSKYLFFIPLVLVLFFFGKF